MDAQYLPAIRQHVSFPGSGALRELITPHCLVDIGAGIRPFTYWQTKHHICVEPYAPYGETLKAAGYEVISKTALDYLREAEPQNTIVMLDCIEHMDKPTGQECIELISEKSRQAVIYTPNGFMEQYGDVWSMGGDYWQEHRSGWVLNDFRGWSCSIKNNFILAIKKQ